MDNWTRRGVLGGVAAGVAFPVWGKTVRPAPRPGVAVPTALPDVTSLIAAARLGGITGYAVGDLATGRVIEAANDTTPLPPASVAKTITSLHALDRLGGTHRFNTRVMAVGSVSGGRLTGDLVLAGGGDPTLDTDKLGDLVAALARTGLREVTGRFLAYAGALPSFERISAEQPVQVGFDPGLSGLALNYNRVNFEWTEGGATVQMNARGQRYVPVVKMARMAVADRATPLFSYGQEPGVEDWSVARTGLGLAGSRWLPVRQVAPYVAEVFQTLCAAQGIQLPQAEVVQVLPPGAVTLVNWQSDELLSILRSMLKFSTNITAETVGLAATGAGSLTASAAAVQSWAKDQLGLDATLVDHSGLGAASRVTAAGMMQALLAGQKSASGAALQSILRNIGLRDRAGKPVKGATTRVLAKSGTLNFVSGLVGFVAPKAGKDLVFAIFTADVARREAVPMDAREEPTGQKDWVRRAHLLQGQLIARWAAAYC